MPAGRIGILDLPIAERRFDQQRRSGRPSQRGMSVEGASSLLARVYRFTEMPARRIGILDLPIAERRFD